VLVVCSIRGEFLARMRIDCQKIIADGLNGQHRLSATDARVRPAHQRLAGVIVPLDETFPAINGPLDPGEEIACRCPSRGIVGGETRGEPTASAPARA